MTPDAPKIDRFRKALAGAGMQVEVRAPKGFPKTLAGMDPFDLIVLANLTSDALSPAGADLMKTYLRERGGALLLACGEESGANGPWKDDKWAALLPVDFSAQQKLPTVALTLVLDTSQSMQGKQLQSVKKSAKAAAAALGPDDLIEVIALHESPKRVVEMKGLNHRKQFEAAIDGMTAVGSDKPPALIAALKLAHAHQKAAYALMKHVIVISDSPAKTAGLREQAKAVIADTVTVTTVALGPAVGDRALPLVADVAGGRHYSFRRGPAEAAELTAIVQKEIELLNTAAKENGWPAEIASDSAASFLEDVDIQGPLLSGSVPAVVKGAPAQAVLTHRVRQALLARWQIGHGWALVWTNQIHRGKWNAEWADSQGWDAFWPALVKHHVRRRQGDAGSSPKAKPVASSRPGAGTSPIRVLCVTEGNSFLRAALLDEYLDVTTVAPAAYPAANGPFDLTIFDGVAPAIAADAGGLFYINPTGPHAPVTSRGQLSEPSMSFDKFDLSAPLLFGFPKQAGVGPALSWVNMLKARRVTPAPADHVVAGSKLGPLLIAGKRDGHDMVVLAFDLLDSDLPLRPVWPILMFNVVQEVTNKALPSSPRAQPKAARPAPAPAAPSKQATSAATVIQRVGKKGFAEPGYRKVYENYKSLVAERLKKVPPTRRQYAARYFEVIRPR